MGEEKPSASEKLPFDLQTGESIVVEVKPEFLGFILLQAFGSVLAVIIFAAIIVIVLSVLNKFVWMLIAILASFIILFLVIAGPIIAYGKFKYWITNHRVVGRRGFIGYSIDSIPLENVTDVVINRSFRERVFGLSSLIIVPMGGPTYVKERGYDESIQTPNFFPALKPSDATDIQRLLFNLRDVRKQETGKIL